MPSDVTVLDDQRLGFFSASQFPIIFACAGAPALWAEVEQQRIRIDDSNPDADRGTRIHEANETGDVSDLEEDEATTVERIRTIEEKLVGDWIFEKGLTLHDVTIYRELRIWVPNLYSAQLDTLVVTHGLTNIEGPYISSGQGLFVLDTKSGRGKVAPPVRNYQLRAQAVAAALKFDSAPVRTAIVQPMSEQQPVCDYSAENLAVAYERIKERIELVKQPGQPRTPGSHCQFCPAKAICPEAKRSMSAVIGVQSLRWDMLAAEDKVRLFKAASLAEDCAAVIRMHIRKELTENPEAIPGLKKQPDQSPRKVTDTAALAKLLCDTAIFEDLPEHDKVNERRRLLMDFVKRCKIPIKEVIAFYAENMPSGSRVSAEAFLKQYCSMFIAEGHRSGVITVLEDES